MKCNLFGHKWRANGQVKDFYPFRIVYFGATCARCGQMRMVNAEIDAGRKLRAS